MIKSIDIEEALDKENIVYIDVRSPKEYQVDTIPNAINIPILNDKERERVGYLYKQVNSQKAKEAGLEYASKKLTHFYTEIKKIIDENKDVALFCYRGGMRSNSIANVLSTMGLDVYLITGGYKSYRAYVMDNLVTYEDKFNYVVLHGYTGVGKTKILKLLEEKDISVLDIEGLARNTGSVFGSLAFKGDSSTQKRFESHLVKSFQNMKSNLVFTESESKRVGKVILPDFLYNNMQNCHHILIKTNMKKRIENIIEDYINSDVPDLNDRIIKALENLRKRLSNNKVDTLINQINDKDYSPVIETLMVDYYDPLYDYSINKVEEYDMIIEYENEENAVDQIIEFANKHVH
ncbi:tRNA 2-selenouridine(34) synthase MnmH [Sporosalibacterium faouarense]|uniref:tRNA 2-selenouridine(34) synthase MnmH n=1 Tax=Sporosalibacterium faouarense TaxID=516123 RepID=UPI00141D5C40|nr:tRNA 2-selenouridine(34) synthase MnmH [Sporosalibacterium faouarense]MTI48055.1 tRNA 2-selenouridine(34) synthase MnmH [Bacillota bacterium]